MGNEKWLRWNLLASRLSITQKEVEELGMTIQTFEYLTYKQVAKRLGVTRQTIYRWIKNGKFPAPVKVGDQTVRFRMKDIERFENSLTAQYYRKR